MGILAIISMLLFIAMVMALIMPNRMLKFLNNPTRGKAFLVYGLPAIILFIFVGAFAESALEEALKNPDSTTNLEIANKRLESIPQEISQLKNLVSLELQKNKITKLPDWLANMDSLMILNLSENPIKEIPDWIASMKSLESLHLDGTEIESLPIGLSNVSISYKNTPLWRAENPELAKEEAENEERTESLGEFAMRKFLGKDYGYRRKFKKGEIFYNDPVTKEQADKVGEMMVNLGFFNDDKEVSMLLDKSKDNIYELKIVVEMNAVEKDEEVIASFNLVRAMVNSGAFPDEILHIHLTNDQFETKRVLKDAE